MANLEFEITIEASSAKIWQVLWEDRTYRSWTSVFNAGSHAISDFKEGSEYQFLSPNGSGLYGTISKCDAHTFIEFQHEGEMRAFNKVDSETNWLGARESYRLEAIENKTRLIVTLVGFSEYTSYFNSAFPKALNKIKELSEKPLLLTVSAHIHSDLTSVWNAWTTPVDIMNWNSASEDWHTPIAKNDLREGGYFMNRMEAKDGSFGFDFKGKYTQVRTESIICYTLEDGRTVEINFEVTGNQVKVTEVFEAETMNSLELQEMGWGAILTNFKKYVEVVKA